MQTARVQRNCALVLVLCLALAGTPSQAGSDTGSSARRLLATQQAYAFGCCGGIMSGLPDASDNAQLACPANYGCRRNSQNYWQCFPGAAVVQPYVAPVPSPPSPPPSPPPPPTTLPSPTANQKNTGVNCTGCTVSIEAWRQCGGKSNCAPDAVCEDAEWPHGCCSEGFSCSRAYEWYWQCLPTTGPLAPSSSARNTFQTPMPASTQTLSQTPARTPTSASSASPQQAASSFYESVNAGKANA